MQRQYTQLARKLRLQVSNIGVCGCGSCREWGNSANMAGRRDFNCGHKLTGASGAVNGASYLESLTLYCTAAPPAS